MNLKAKTRTYTGRIISIMRSRTHRLIYGLDTGIEGSIDVFSSLELGFQMKKGQIVELTGIKGKNGFFITSARLLEDRDPTDPRFFDHYEIIEQ